MVASIPEIKGTQPSRGIDFWKSCAHHSAPTKVRWAINTTNHMVLSKGLIHMHSELAEERPLFKVQQGPYKHENWQFKPNYTCEKGEKMAQVDQHKAFSWSIDYRKNKCICKKAAQSKHEVIQEKTRNHFNKK